MPAQGVSREDRGSDSPGSGSRRRRLGGLLAVLVSTLLAAWAFEMWEPPAEPDPRAALLALARAEVRLHRQAPEASTELAELSREALSSSSPDRWDIPLAFAARELRNLAVRRAELAERWRREEEAVAPEVERMHERSQTPGLGYWEARQAWIAELAWSRAKRRAAQGDFAAALEEAAEARDAAAQVEETWQGLHRRFERSDLLRQWSTWEAETVAESRRTGDTALVVEKLRRRLTVYSAGRPVGRFRVELGVDGLRRKLSAGDRATPEGRYRVTDIKTGGATRFYKALLLDYPNSEDWSRYRQAQREGTLPDGRGIGGLIEIHGRGGRGTDWTDGCIALTDAEMDWLVPRVRVGTPVAVVGALR